MRRYQVPEDLAGLLRSEWDTIIEQANLEEIDECIVREVLIQRYTLTYAGTGIDRERTTIYRRLPKIINRVRDVAKRLNMIS